MTPASVTLVTLVTLAAALTSVTLAVGPMQLTPEMQAGLLQHHNQVRRESGHSMPDLLWDGHLSTLAAEAAANCQNRHFNWAKGFGENLSWKRGGLFSHLAPMNHVMDASHKWAMEIMSYQKGGWDCMKYGGDPPCDTCGCNHYAQMVWPKTTHMGCAIHACPRLKTMVYCVYAPQGNAGHPW